jgi:hypothetical protein
MTNQGIVSGDRAADLLEQAGLAHVTRDASGHVIKVEEAFPHAFTNLGGQTVTMHGGTIDGPAGPEMQETSKGKITGIGFKPGTNEVVVVVNHSDPVWEPVGGGPTWGPGGGATGGGTTGGTGGTGGGGTGGTPPGGGAGGGGTGGATTGGTGAGGTGTPGVGGVGGGGGTGSTKPPATPPPQPFPPNPIDAANEALQKLQQAANEASKAVQEQYKNLQGKAGDVELARNTYKAMKSALGEEFADDAIEKLATKLGVDPATAKKLVQMDDGSWNFIKGAIELPNKLSGGGS